MTRIIANPDLAPTGAGPRVLVCVQGTRNVRQGNRLRALLTPLMGNVRLSTEPEIVATPELTLLVNGWGELDTVPAVRECLLRFSTPVIVLLSSRRAALTPEVLRAGATDCARWPITRDELLARVETRITPISVAVTLDAVTLTLRCGATVAKLTPSEYRVAHHLLSNSSRWSTSKEMTMAALRPTGASKGLLRGVIYSIRRKLQNEAWRIVHDRRLGYRFDVRATHSSERDESGTPV